LPRASRSPRPCRRWRKPGLAVNLDRRIGEIFELAAPESLFVPTLSVQRQALFATRGELETAPQE
jgi:hypothetical protein